MCTQIGYDFSLSSNVRYNYSVNIQWIRMLFENAFDHGVIFLFAYFYKLFSFSINQNLVELFRHT